MGQRVTPSPNIWKINANFFKLDSINKDENICGAQLSRTNSIAIKTLKSLKCYHTKRSFK